LIDLIEEDHKRSEEEEEEKKTSVRLKYGTVMLFLKLSCFINYGT
jgi:hypothetical protein